MSNKTTVRSHLFIYIIEIIQRTEHEEEMGPSFLLEGMLSGAAGMEFNMGISHELKLALPDNPAMPLLGEYLPKRHLHTFVLLLYSHHSYEREPAHMSHRGEMDKLSTDRVDGRGRGDGENKRGGLRSGCKISENFNY